jgi:hypothetical protein
MNDRVRLIIGVFLIALVVISFNFSFDSLLDSPQSADFISEFDKIPDGSVVAVHLVALYDESVEIEPAFTTLLWHLSRRKMKVVFVPLTVEGRFVLERGAETVRSFLSRKEFFPEIVTVGFHRPPASELSWTVCHFTPGSLFAMRHFALDYLGCHDEKTTPLHDLKAVVVVGSTGFDGMPAPMLYTLFGQKAGLKTPLFVLASAQKRPLLEPLVRTGQITAMITGNRNSFAFASQLHSPIDFSKRIGATTVLIAAVILLFIGAVIYILFRKKKR